MPTADSVAGWTALSWPPRSAINFVITLRPWTYPAQTTIPPRTGSLPRAKSPFQAGLLSSAESTDLPSKTRPPPRTKPPVKPDSRRGGAATSVVNSSVEPQTSSAICGRTTNQPGTNAPNATRSIRDWICSADTSRRSIRSWPPSEAKFGGRLSVGPGESRVTVVLGLRAILGREKTSLLCLFYSALP